MFIDTHSHIYSEEFTDNSDEVVARAIEAGVERIILPDIDSQTRPAMLELAERYPQTLFPLVGVHPTSVNEHYKAELASMEREVGTRRFYGVGECGIDLYWDKTYYKEQVKTFEHQLGIAGDMNLPVVIHSRESLNEIFDVLKRHPYARGVLHCFPGDEKEAELACRMGFLLGIGGVITFKNTHLDKVVRKVGAENIVLETDSPYLTPVPYRGKRNESSYIPLIAQRVAEVLETDIKNIERITSNNAMNLFNLQSETIA